MGQESQSKMRLKSAIFAAFILSSMSSQASADDLFQVTITSDGVTKSIGFNTATDAINQFKNGELQSLIPSYSNTSVATGMIDYRGLTVIAAYATSGTTLRFQVPAAGIDQSFTGDTRDKSQQMLLDYLKNNNAYGAVMHALAAASSVDPVAGNPSSLQSNMVSQGFNAAFNTNRGGNIDGMPRNSLGLGLTYGHFTNSDYNLDAYTIPLSYNFGIGHDGNYRVEIDLPLTYLNTQGAQSGAASLGIGVTIPITTAWSLTPRVSAGAT